MFVYVNNRLPALVPFEESGVLGRSWKGGYQGDLDLVRVDIRDEHVNELNEGLTRDADRTEVFTCSEIPGVRFRKVAQRENGYIAF